MDDGILRAGVVHDASRSRPFLWRPGAEQERPLGHGAVPRPRRRGRLRAVRRGLRLVGRDRLGDLAREDLEREGVEHHFIQTDAHLTGSVAVFVDQTGERSMVSGRGADFFLLPQELPKSIINRSDYLFLSAWSFFTDPPRTAARLAAEIGRASDKLISFDPASFQMIQDMGPATFWSYVKDLGIKVNIIILHNRGSNQRLANFF